MSQGYLLLRPAQRAHTYNDTCFLVNISYADNDLRGVDKVGTPEACQVRIVLRGVRCAFHFRSAPVFQTNRTKNALQGETHSVGFRRHEVTALHSKMLLMRKASWTTLAPSRRNAETTRSAATGRLTR